MRNTKAKKYTELKGQRNSRDYESWFLRYIPFENKMDKEEKKADKEAGKDAGKETAKEEVKEADKEAEAKPVKMKKTVTWKKVKKPMAKTKKNKGKKGIFGFF
jgi:hypothetical protein